ncbi:hypothetical protein I6E18_10030 [Phocaeicola barnesiae]|uniref:hypothetical protein n=1 Tax=Phocaeicola barnesiae TaxID=376804 RepID=UPI001F2F5B5F|nr:hypothetical protein [Phocaeicola barnesiae]MCF2576499.1 hypothetical protein [Phocaeicola barnesiae]
MATNKSQIEKWITAQKKHRLSVNSDFVHQFFPMVPVFKSKLPDSFHESGNSRK